MIVSMKRVLMSWSSGKDSAWALHRLRHDPAIEIVELPTTLNSEFQRVAMHGTRRSVLEAQAEVAQLPLWIVPLPWPCSNEIYEQRMAEICDRAVNEHVDAIAFGDLFLRDVRAYREKQLAPTGLDAIVNGCNQRSNREPVLDLDEDAVRHALHGLEDQRLAGPVRGTEGRVTKYEHWLGEAFNLSRAETALLCVLLLRGPQTPGELRGRTERMHRFEEIGDVLGGLQRLMEHEPPLAAVLPRQPGTKESRYAQLLSGPVQMEPASAPAFNAVAGTATRDQRIENLEEKVAELEIKIASLTARIDDLFGN